MTEATGKVAAPTLRSIGMSGRYRGVMILGLAALVGIAAGLVVTAMRWVTQHFLTEADLLRRYAEELGKSRQDLTGEA